LKLLPAGTVTKDVYGVKAGTVITFSSSGNYLELTKDNMEYWFGTTSGSYTFTYHYWGSVQYGREMRSFDVKCPITVTWESESLTVTAEVVQESF